MELLSGGEMIAQALEDEGVEYIFGYPGGAVLHIYDALFKASKVPHVLVRHEQAATHAADGYARATGKPGVVLVTSGPGATNAITGIATAYMDSIPMVVLSGQVQSHLIGEDAFQETDMVGISRPIVKHSYQARHAEELPGMIKKAFHLAASGRPGPVVIDIPKDITRPDEKFEYTYPETVKMRSYSPAQRGYTGQIKKAARLLLAAKRPVIYSGGGVIQGEGSDLLVELTRMLNFPITNTLMGLGAYPGSDRQFLGMLGMHGFYEANMAMHDCDLMINIGARFDDRITGRLDAFSPGSTKAHIDIDASSINKVIKVDIPILGDCAHVLEDLLNVWKSRGRKTDKENVTKWWHQINEWKKIDCLSFKQEGKIIKPQYALSRLEELTKKHDRYICTEVGQHQMWAAQYLGFEDPNRWMTSGGLGTMGYGFPASIGVQMGHPDALVINVAGEASWLMNMQELGTAMQYRLPVKQFILNNERLGMVRQWQELLHGERYSSSWSESLPDFVKLAEAFGAKGIQCHEPDSLDDAIMEMITHDGPVLFDCLVEKHENCFPMIPSGKPHNEMLLGENADVANAIKSDGAVMV